jgi:hypothetical protein
VTLLSTKPHDTCGLARTLFVLGAGVVLALSVSLALASPAAAAKNTPCGTKVLNDWWDNGRVDRLYPLHCYEEAIDAIPADIRDYSDAEQVISRALQAAVGGKLASGGSDPSDDDSGIRQSPSPVPGGSGDPPTGTDSRCSPRAGSAISRAVARPRARSTATRTTRPTRSPDAGVTKV